MYTSYLFIRYFNALLKAFATNSFGKRWVEARKWNKTYLDVYYISQWGCKSSEAAFEVISLLKYTYF